MEVILKSMLWIEVKMLVAPWTTHSRVSGIAMGVHQDTKTGSFREQRGNTPENLPSIKITCKKISEPSVKRLSSGQIVSWDFTMASLRRTVFSLNLDDFAEILLSFKSISNQSLLSFISSLLWDLTQLYLSYNSVVIQL